MPRVGWGNGIRGGALVTILCFDLLILFPRYQVFRVISDFLNSLGCIFHGKDGTTDCIASYVCCGCAACESETLRRGRVEPRFAESRVLFLDTIAASTKIIFISLINKTTNFQI